MFQTFVINLDKDTDRLQFMDAQLARCNINYHRQTAILGREYAYTPAEYDESLAVEKGGHALLPGEIGCALSHALVLEKIVTEKIPYTLVLEDDVELPKNIKDIIETMIEGNTTRKWEYLLFDYVPVGVPFIRQWLRGVFSNFKKHQQQSFLRAISYLPYVFLKGCYIIPLSIFEGVRDNYMKKRGGPVRFFRPVYFAGAYLINLKGAEKMYALTRPVVYTADQLPNRARILKGLRFRCYAPRIVEQRREEFGSSILNLTAAEVRALLK